ncbi:MAG: hypothetical protein IKE22_05370 [Atopobiaceae bacterium]|nr:hypothetical protein [Atopobiaceae bacterium]
MIETFAMLGVPASQVDAMYRLGKGTTREIMVGWWHDDRHGNVKTDAVRRWHDDVSHFLASGDDEDDMPLRGLSPKRVADLLGAAISYLPYNVQAKVRVRERDGHVYLQRTD